MTAAAMARQYPITPLPDNDRRFSIGLAVDVAKVLQEHGYPQIVGGRDLLELQQALFRFLYTGPEATS